MIVQTKLYSQLLQLSCVTHYNNYRSQNVEHSHSKPVWSEPEHERSTSGTIAAKQQLEKEKPGEKKLQRSHLGKEKGSEISITYCSDEERHSKREVTYSSIHSPFQETIKICHFAASFGVHSNTGRNSNKKVIHAGSVQNGGAIILLASSMLQSGEHR